MRLNQESIYWVFLKFENGLILQRTSTAIAVSTLVI